MDRFRFSGRSLCCKDDVIVDRAEPCRADKYKHHDPTDRHHDNSHSKIMRRSRAHIRLPSVPKTVRKNLEQNADAYFVRSSNRSMRRRKHAAESDVDYETGHTMRPGARTARAPWKRRKLNLHQIVCARDLCMEPFVLQAT